MRHIKGLTRPAKAQGIWMCIEGWLNGEWPFFGETSMVDCLLEGFGKDSCN
jgi:hypothetical protein